MSRVGEICVQRVDKIDAEKRKTATARVCEAVAVARAKLGGIDASAEEYIQRVHRRLVAEEASAAAK
jgi:hypothetical protein